MDEQKGERSDGVAAIGTEKDEERTNEEDEKAVKGTCKGLSKRIRNMPQQIRAVHAQREKEKGNEVCKISVLHSRVVNNRDKKTVETRCS